MSYYSLWGRIILGKVQVFDIFPCINLSAEMILQLFWLLPEIISWQAKNKI